MKLPFTTEQFFEVFKNYNESVFPIQIIFYLLALTVIFLSIKKFNGADRIINAVLSFFWFWMGVVYHLFYFTSINKAAYLFGVVFILQGLLFFYQGVVKDKLTYKFRFDKFGWTGAVLIAFALIIYPLLGFIFGHFYPTSPTFGLPCPTTIFTFGILIWHDKRITLSILIIPSIWAIIGLFAALQLGVWEDTGLLVAGILATLVIFFKRKRNSYGVTGIRPG
jgi:hypothetical protein